MWPSFKYEIFDVWLFEVPLIELTWLFHSYQVQLGGNRAGGHRNIPQNKWVIFHFINIFILMQGKLIFGLMSLILLGCKESDEQKKKEQNMQHSYTEQFRPQYHFSPTEKWMNDPNGLVYNEGIYHLFYQYYPDDIVWGPMHW